MSQLENKSHQQGQLAVISQIEEQIKKNALNFTTVLPVADYVSDERISLTSVHFPDQTLLGKIQTKIIQPLKTISPNHFFYSNDSLHMTIKNIRVINDPPHFNSNNVSIVKDVFENTIPQHTKFNVYFYRLLLFPNNLALIGTTDPELDNIVLDLNEKLIAAGVPDDKKYLNSKYFFCNMSLIRFNEAISDEFRKKVAELSETISFEPYCVDSVSLVICNAVFTKKNVIESWQLSESK